MDDNRAAGWLIRMLLWEERNDGCKMAAVVEDGEVFVGSRTSALERGGVLVSTESADTDKSILLPKTCFSFCLGRCTIADDLITLGDGRGGAKVTGSGVESTISMISSG